MAPIRLQDLMRGTDIPRGVRFWPDWFEIPPYREMRDADGRRVYPRSPGIHTVRIRTARRKREQAGRVRDFSPANGGSTSPVFEFTIATEGAMADVEGLQTRDTRRPKVFEFAITAGGSDD
jgi:hypothetical protein